MWCDTKVNAGGHSVWQAVAIGLDFVQELCCVKRANVCGGHMVTDDRR